MKTKIIEQNGKYFVTRIGSKLGMELTDFDLGYIYIGQWFGLMMGGL